MNALETIPEFIPIPAVELTEIVDRHMMELSFDYVKQYQENPKNLIRCFLNHLSVRIACAFIVNAYERAGALRECKLMCIDFSEYANKQNLDERWKRVLNEILIIIYSLTR